MVANRQLAQRTGRYVRQQGGYMAFLPADLPFRPPLACGDDLLALLSRADQALGRVDAVADMLPNPELFVGMYVRKEAVLSSQIEGVTQASLSEVVEYEARDRRRGLPSDIAEVMNYVNAMNYGLHRLEKLPLSNRLMREIHAKLLENVRGSGKSPGEFRRTQNWIGPPGADLSTALFVPPPVPDMQAALDNLERYLHDPAPVPILFKAGIAHYQFETIHPFLDGNGRMGRLLIVFYLCQQGVLKRPLLYLSQFVKAHKDEYYERLQAVRDQGDLEGWMKFFLTAVWKVSEAAAGTAHSILKLREQHRQRIQQAIPGSTHGIELLDHLFSTPVVSVRSAAKAIGVTYPTANSLIESLCQLGILKKAAERSRNRLFLYTEYLGVMEQGLEAQAKTR